MIVAILILVALLLIGVPVPLCFVGATVFIVITRDIPITILLPAGYTAIKSVILLAVFFFVLAGELMNLGGIAVRLLDLVNAFISRIKGGLGVVVIVTTAIFGAMSGSSAAALSAIGTIMIPRMEEHGYPRGYAAAVATLSAPLALLIPPSISLVLIGWVTQISIAACFLCTVGPALLLVVAFSLINRWMIRDIPLKLDPKISFKETSKIANVRFWRAAPGLLMPFIILGGIYSGIFTATEAATVAVVYSLPVGFLIYRSLTVRKLGSAFISSATTTAVVIVMLFFIMILSRVLTMENIPQKMATFLLGISDNKYIILLLVSVFLLLLGMLIDDASGIILASPLLMPVMMEIGVHPLHFVAIVTTNLTMGTMTPPTAPMLYFGIRIGGVTLQQIFKPAMTLLLLGNLPVVIATVYWPDLSLFLPRLLGYT